MLELTSELMEYAGICQGQRPLYARDHVLITPHADCSGRWSNHERHHAVDRDDQSSQLRPACQMQS